VLNEILVQAEASVDLGPLMSQAMALAQGALVVVVTACFYYGVISAHGVFLAMTYGLIALLILGACSFWMARRSRRDMHQFWMMPDGVILHTPAGRIIRRPWADLCSAVSSDRDPRRETMGRRVLRLFTSPANSAPEDAAYCTLRFRPSCRRCPTQLPLRVVVLVSPADRVRLKERLEQIVESARAGR
jgi:hypothetical protein